MRRLILALCTLSLVVAIPFVGSGAGAAFAASNPGCDGSDVATGDSLIWGTST